jgi:hypothetical protein
VLLLSTGHDELIRLTERIQNDFRGRVREFRLDADSRGLILHGITRTYHEKQLVQHAVLRAAWIPIAANEIIVE